MGCAQCYRVFEAFVTRAAAELHGVVAEEAPPLSPARIPPLAHPPAQKEPRLSRASNRLELEPVGRLFGGNRIQRALIDETDALSVRGPLRIAMLYQYPMMLPAVSFGNTDFFSSAPTWIIQSQPIKRRNRSVSAASVSKPLDRLHFVLERFHTTAPPTWRRTSSKRRSTGSVPAKTAAETHGKGRVTHDFGPMRRSIVPDQQTIPPDKTAQGFSMLATFRFGCQHQVRRQAVTSTQTESHAHSKRILLGLDQLHSDFAPASSRS